MADSAEATVSCVIQNTRTHVSSMKVYKIVERQLLDIVKCDLIFGSLHTIVLWLQSLICIIG